MEELYAKIAIVILFLGNLFWLVMTLVEKDRAEDWKQSSDHWKDAARGWERVALGERAIADRSKNEPAQPAIAEPIVRRHLRLVKY